MSQPNNQPNRKAPGSDPAPTAPQTAAPSSPPTGKYGALIQKAKSGDAPFDDAPLIEPIEPIEPIEIEPIEDQNSGKPENQNAGLPEVKAEPKEEEVNLSIKVAKRLRRHWASEAKRQDTTLTAVIIGALREKFGEPQSE